MGQTRVGDYDVYPYPSYTYPITQERSLVEIGSVIAEIYLLLFVFEFVVVVGGGVVTITYSCHQHSWGTYSNAASCANTFLYMPD